MIKTFKRQRFWVKRDGTRLPVKEAPYEHPVAPTDEDFKNAIPCDHFKCAYACYWMRAQGSTEAWVGHTDAYVDLPDAKGKRWMYHFVLSVAAHRNANKFDEGEELPSHTVIFKKPSKSQTLAARELAHVEWELEQSKNNPRQKPKQKADMVGLAKKGQDIKKARQTRRVATLRKSGTGMIHFIPAQC